MLGETLPEIRICLTEFVLFSSRYICKTLRVQKNYPFGTFPQSNSSLEGENLRWQCLSEVFEIFVRNLSEMRKKVSENKPSEIKRPNSFASNVTERFSLDYGACLPILNLIARLWKLCYNTNSLMKPNYSQVAEPSCGIKHVLKLYMYIH